MKPRTTDQMTHDAATRDPIGAMTPRQIVEALNRYIVGQDQAKRAVAIALRNRWRRQHLPEGLRQEVMPKNILMIGPTGVGKTEIARRVATIADAPFLKVEATKFTEVGYVGRDVETIVRDLVEVSIGMLHGQRLEAVREAASSAAIQRLADLLIEQRAANRRRRRKATPREAEAIQDPAQRRRHEANVRRRLARQRARMLDLLQKEALEDETVELETDQEFDAIIPLEFAAGMSPEELHETFSELLEGFAPRRRSRKVSVREARQILTQQEANRLVDFDSVVEEAVRRAEERSEERR